MGGSSSLQNTIASLSNYCSSHCAHGKAAPPPTPTICPPPSVPTSLRAGPIVFLIPFSNFVLMATTTQASLWYVSLRLGAPTPDIFSPSTAQTLSSPSHSPSVLVPPAPSRSQGPPATQAFLLVNEDSLRVEDNSDLCLKALWCVVQTFSLYGQSCLQPLALSLAYGR